MRTTENKRRKRRTKRPDSGSLWGFLFHNSTPPNDMTRGTLYARPEEDEVDYAQQKGLLAELWSRFNFWSFLATVLFVSFVAVLMYGVTRMWQPQSLKDIAGYNDKLPAKDLSVLIRNANGGVISFTEGELNRYLRDTCRMRQTGIFSIFANAQGVAVRVHNGYAELIIDRLVGANMHQTTAVNLTFHRDIVHGRPSLSVEFHGGSPLMGNMPRGGRIGTVGIPQKHIQVMQPALKTLLECYPDIVAATEEYGYCPIFEKESPESEGRITLIPYTPQQSTP
ncbi:MAG: hypothetical protein IJ943_06085 [Akkermansia sp.]|nr:hypothetical protein [Akkermansia sp.]